MNVTTLLCSFFGAAYAELNKDIKCTNKQVQYTYILDCLKAFTSAVYYLRA